MGIAHITLATPNVRATRDFFAATLGWRPIDRPSNIPVSAAWLEICPGQEIHLVEVKHFEPSPFEREFGRHTAIRVPVDSFPQLKSRLVAGGAQLIPPERETPFERFFFQEPNGYVFEVIGQPEETD